MSLFKPKDEQAWFSFHTNEGNERYKLRYTDYATIKEINDDEKLLLHVITAWEGVTVDVKGVEKSECTDETKKAFFRTRGGKLRLEWMLQRANDHKAFETDEETLKNLQAPFAGATSTLKQAQNGATNANKVAA